MITILRLLSLFIAYLFKTVLNPFDLARIAASLVRTVRRRDP